MSPEPDRDRERADTATAALAQLVATTEEFQRRAIAAEALAHATQGEAQLGQRARSPTPSTTPSPSRS